MSRLFRALALLVFVSGCGSRNFEAPRELDDACAIVDENPSYLRAFRATERRWGVPVAVQMAIIYQESKFVGNARTPFQWTLGVIPIGRQSSAYGYAQALDGTWEEYQDQQGGRRARRDNIRDATDFMGWYMLADVRGIGRAAERHPQPVPRLPRRPLRLSPGEPQLQGLAAAGGVGARVACVAVPHAADGLPAGVSRVGGFDGVGR